jgi:hypothetical protein
MKTIIFTIILSAVSCVAQLPPKVVPFLVEQKINDKLIHVFQSAIDNQKFGEPTIMAGDGTELQTGQYTLKNIKDGSFLFNFNVNSAVFPLTVTNGTKVTQITEGMVEAFPKYVVDLIETDTFICYIRATDNAEVVALLAENLEILVRGRALLKKMDKNPAPYLYKKYENEFIKDTAKQNENRERINEIRNHGKAAQYGVDAR